jgi:hypothetical protein
MNNSKILVLIIVIKFILGVMFYKSKSPKNQAVSNLDCLYQDNSKKQIPFPFNKADNLEVVSFNNGEGEVVAIKNGKFILLEIPNKVDSIAKKFRRKIQEKVVLDAEAIKNLSNLLYNYNTIDGNSIANDCYDPHHAILFYKKDKAIAFLEVCFSCTNIRSSENVVFEGFCLEKYKKLKNFIDSVGIKYKEDMNLNI